MNILVLEDEVNQREMLKICIEKKFLDVRVYEARTEEEAKKIIENGDIIDLFFLDIKLREGSGLDFAKYIRKIEKYEISPIVFISGQVSYIVEALKEVNCFDYLLKPYTIERVYEIVEKFLRHLKKRENNNYIFFKDVNGDQIKIYHKDILFLEYYLKKCIIHTKIGSINIRTSGIENIIKEINYKNIIRTHKSYAINLDNMKDVKKVNSKLWEIGFYNYDKKADLSYSFRNNLSILK
ncbi:LytTR family DNA-binding domain-containing protein [Clostridium sp. AL.422]|uniref:LytR/AlgR family response regulator transcription factor n=1 Tax=Clostridium TaxID=1485 RepID=UPI00293DBC85|nr:MULTISPECIES: LytTR family DNA-binding domain-containing protein [unclassified Clostridium]MDV4151998.1 LytTR family DNA-binding domain-containing protein [Clostridium sp. AL.422]